MSIERYEPDSTLNPDFLQNALESGLAMDAGGSALFRRFRYLLQKWEIGEPPMRDRMQDVPMWAEQRLLELSEYIAAHQSEVSIVRDHQVLWGISDRQELERIMTQLLSGVSEKEICRERRIRSTIDLEVFIGADNCRFPHP